MTLKSLTLNYLLVVLFAGLVLLPACNHTSKEEQQGVTNVPTPDEVGVLQMPDTIAAVSAPFAMPKFSKPTFPADTVVVQLVENQSNRAIIQSAIDQTSKQGGGVVVIPNGTWKTGRIELKSNVNLHFEEKAILLFSGEIEDYLPVVFTRVEGVEVFSLGACIYANNAHNIALTGKGQLVGPAEGSVRERILTSEVIDNVIDPDTPVAERIVDGKKQDWIFPPMFISPINCSQVYIEGISLTQTAFWNIVPVYCNQVIIRGVTVNSVGIPRGDGIDIESSKNVLIEYCDLSSGDDCFTMKAGRGKDGMRVNRPTENVVVRFCMAREGHGGITVGSETAGTIRNLYVHDCVFEDTGVGIRFKTRRPRGGGGENLYYERIRMHLRYTAIKWDMLGSSAHVGELANRLPARPVNELTPHYKNIHIKDVVIENATHLLKVIGIPEAPVENLRLENVQAHCSNFIQAADLKGAHFLNISMEGNDSVVILQDVSRTTFQNVAFHTANAPVALFVEGDMSDSIRVTGCTNLPDTLFVKAIR